MQDKPPHKPGRTNWSFVNALTEDEIESLAAEDEDNPATTEADWVHASIGMPPMKTPVNAEFDADVVNWFKAQGRGYQSRMNAVLRRYMEAHRKTG